MNLANLPKEQRDQIDEDKKRWLKCRQMLKEKTRSQIVAWLNSLPEHEREDMRKRLNSIKYRKNGYE